MKIKITKRLLKEAGTKPPQSKIDPDKTHKLSDPTWKPEGPGGTKKFDAVDAFGEPSPIEINYMQSSSDPTLKVSPEDLKRELSKVIEEPGLLNKVLGYFKSKFFSEPSAEAPAELPSAPKPAPAPKMKKASKPLPPPAKLADMPDAEPSELGDEMEEPDPYGRRSKNKEARAFVDKFGQLQEIARRHFKTGK